MSTAGLPPLLDEPVWYEPLRRPSWLLPSVREDAPRVRFRPGSGADEDLRLGLPLFLGEAVRFSSDARVEVGTGDQPVPVGLAAVVTTEVGARTVIDIADADDGSVEELLLPGPEDPALGAALATLPSALMAALTPRGVRPAWSTVFQAPPADRAVASVRARGTLARLRTLAGTPPGEPDGEPHGIDARAGLGHLAKGASARSSPLDVALFIAGLGVAKEAGWSAWRDFRLEANAIAQGAKDPLDPVFRLSIASSILFGDTGEASARAQLLGRDAPEDLRAWLARFRA